MSRRTRLRLLSPTAPAIHSTPPACCPTLLPSLPWRPACVSPGLLPTTMPASETGASGTARQVKQAQASQRAKTTGKLWNETGAREPASMPRKWKDARCFGWCVRAMMALAAAGVLASQAGFGFVRFGEECWGVSIAEPAIW